MTLKKTTKFSKFFSKFKKKQEKLKKLNLVKKKEKKYQERTGDIEFSKEFGELFSDYEEEEENKITPKFIIDFESTEN